MTTGMVLDLLLVGLLVATIGYAARLNKRLGGLRKGKEELRGLINDFMNATQQAHAGLEELREASEGSARALQEKVDEAQALREDLGFLIERGGVVADRLVHDVRGARAASGDASGKYEGNAKASPQPTADDPVMNLRKILEATR